MRHFEFLLSVRAILGVTVWPSHIRCVFFAVLPYCLTVDLSCHADGPPQWVLLDGDKIASLFAMLLQQELTAAGLTDAYTCAVVQTAYANGASTQFIRKLGMPIHLAKTGVKYLHHKAQEFDVGIYFEANGHGTVIFSERFQQAVREYVPSGEVWSARVDLAFARLKVRVN